MLNRIIPARAGFTGPASATAWPGTDHPRSRGVYRRPSGAYSPRPGSSPLARGLLGVDYLRECCVRIIPARAGFTYGPAAAGTCRRDHPRSRGVYAAPLREPLATLGSSPLARGLPSGDCARDPRHRIIPARAGFTAPASRPHSRYADHPRSRGVYDPTTHKFPCPPGSSPLARGLLTLPQPVLIRGGIIPARAGFTLRHYFFSSSGEGSSPLARGLHLREGGCDANGIIPARAGFTWPIGSAPMWCRGSSPLARGLPLLVMCWLGRPGIIPARAGFTLRTSPNWVASRDHPRSRGVYVNAWCNMLQG